MASNVVHQYSEPPESSGLDPHGCRACALASVRANGQSIEWRGQDFLGLRTHLAFALMKSGRAILHFGMRRLYPDCPLRASLESLGELADVAFSLSSTNRRATS